MSNEHKNMSGDDPVSHPSHYNQFSVEVIELTRALPFDLGNSVKYVLRSPFKGNAIQDLEKAEWYLRDYLAHEDSFRDVVITESTWTSFKKMSEELDDDKSEFLECVFSGHIALALDVLKRIADKEISR